MRKKDEKIRHLFESEEEFSRWVNVRRKEKVSLSINLLFMFFLSAQVYYYKYVAITDGYPSGGKEFLLEYIFFVVISLFAISNIDALIDNSLQLSKLKRLERERILENMTVEEALEELFKRNP